MYELQILSRSRKLWRDLSWSEHHIKAHSSIFLVASRERIFDKQILVYCFYSSFFSCLLWLYFWCCFRLRFQNVFFVVAWNYFFCLNQQNFIKNQISAEDEHIPCYRKYKLKAPYEKRNTRKQTPTKTPLRSTPIRTSPTK